MRLAAHLDFRFWISDFNSSISRCWLSIWRSSYIISNFTALKLRRIIKKRHTRYSKSYKIYKIYNIYKIYIYISRSISKSIRSISIHKLCHPENPTINSPDAAGSPGVCRCCWVRCALRNSVAKYRQRMQLTSTDINWPQFQPKPKHLYVDVYGLTLLVEFVALSYILSARA